MKPVVTLIALWFGAGRSPVAPGTVGTLAALPFAWGIQVMAGNVGLLAAAVVAFVGGIWAAGRYCAISGRLDDPKEVVIDEVAGIWLMLAFMPLSWLSYVVAFAVFRFFDAVKPWPISLADRKIKGAFGIMFDDLLAAIFGWMFIALAVQFLPSLPPLLAWPWGGDVF